MPQAWETIDSVETDEGLLELIRADGGDWMITIERRSLMSSRLTRSEIALAELACEPYAEHPAPHVLVSGLGMGFTLRAALDALPKTARVVTVELNPIVARWNQGPIAALSKNSLDDPRVTLEIENVSQTIARAAKAESDDERFDALILDLYEGPYPPPRGQEDVVFGRHALGRARAALRPGGCLAVWSEGPVESFEKRVPGCGFRLERHRPKYKGPRHIVYLAWPN
ncbi:MAG: spermidine synthase [Planctomycetota bacterium]